jgi:hypothetical protein
MPVTFTTALSDAQTPTLNNGIEDEIGVSWPDVTDNGWYRTRFRETSDSDWLTALSARETITAADATTSWGSGSNATVSTVPNPSEDGTSVRGVTDDTATQGSRYIAFAPGTNDDLTAESHLQFWYYTDNLSGADSLTLTDGGGTSETVSFEGSLEESQGQLVQVALANYTSVDLGDVAEYRWVFDGDGTGIDKTIYVDAVLAGSDRAGEATTSLTVPRLEDGEEYEFRHRTETEHVTGSWSATASITTQFPTPDSASAGSPTKTSIDLSWNEYADNEDGFRVYRAREYDSGWGPFEVVADLAPNTTAHTDDTVSPGNTYKYYIEAYTEHTTSQSGETSAVTTTSSGRPRERTGASGWEVKVEHPSGETLRPQLLDDPQYTPVVRDYPRVEIPVPRDEKWQASAFEGATVSVWKDGRILPIEELVDVQMEPGRTVLKARGGTALADRVQAEYDNKEAHLAAEELGQNNTPYTMNVDDPATNTQSDTLMQSGDSNSELRDHLNSPIAATDPVTIENSKLKLQQSCFVAEAENPTRETDPNYWMDVGKYSGGDGRGVYSSTSNLEWDFTVPYRMPASAIGLKGRVIDTDNAQEMEINLRVDGTWYNLDYLTGGEGTVFGWDELAQSGAYNGTGYDGSADIPAGSTVTVQMTSTGSNGGDYGWDILALYDARYSYFFDTDNGGNQGYLDGPQLRPDAHTVVFEDASTAFNVTAGQIDLTIDNTANGQAVALSNDQGSSWTEAANTASFQTDFGSAGSTIRFRVTLSRYGSQTGATPKTGIYGQQVDAFEEYADLEDTPVLDGQKYDGQLIEVLNRIAEYGNFFWELQRDSGGWRIEWTQPGQRTADTSTDLIEYTVSKNVENTYEKAIIKGAAQPIRGEQFTSNYDSWVALNQARLIPATEIVRDPSSGETYELGSDYELDRTDGRIKVLSSGAMSDATTYEIDYSYKTQGSYTASDAGSDPDTIVRTISAITSNRGCDQAALYLIQRIQDPQWDATVTVPTTDPGISLVDKLGIDELPTNGNRVVFRDIEQTAKQVVFRARGQRVSEVVSDISTRVSNVADRV